MNCTEVIATLSTASLRDLTPDSAVMLHEELLRSRNLIHDFERDPKAACNSPPLLPFDKDRSSPMNADRNAAPALAPDKVTSGPKTR